MNDNPLVSIIVPLFNYEKYIAHCIRSIECQSYDNWELIITDDCSTDDSYNVAKSFENDKIRVLKTDINSGYSIAKNQAIKASHGDYITCLDADDMMTKHSVSARLKFLIDQGVDLVHARAISVSGDISYEKCLKLTKPFKRDTPRIHAQTVLMKRSVHRDFGLYDEKLRSRADKEMWIRLFGKNCEGNHLVKKGFLNKDVAFYRKHGNSMMVNRRKDPNKQIALTNQLEQSVKERCINGINKTNTVFLES